MGADTHSSDFGGTAAGTEHVVFALNRAHAGAEASAGAHAARQYPSRFAKCRLRYAPAAGGRLEHGPAQCP